MSKALAVIAGCGLSLAVLAAGCSSGTGGGGSSPAATSSAGGPGGSRAGAASPALAWRSCAQLAPRLQCASLKVPLNYAKPGGRKITLALTRLPATAPPGQRQGALLVNPGGPGGSGLTMAAYAGQSLDPQVAAQYDIIGFDTRGTGSSVPALHCDPGYFSRARPDYIPADKAEERAWISRARGYAQDCQRKYGWLLPYMTTRDIARDLDSIRVALGQSKISYLAFSYGTYIGQVYATMFPGRVRRMVLDSIVDPAGVWYRDNLQQDYAFQGRVEAFFSWTARYDATYRLGATAAAVSRSWHAARQQLEDRPVAGSAGPLIGPDEFDDTFLAGGYNNQYWPSLAAALASYLHQGGTSQLRRLYQQIGKQDENEFAVYNAVECSDVSWPRSWARWDTDARKIYKTAPYEAWDNTWFNAACAFWPVRGPQQPMKIGAAGLPGILMLQGTGDGATPYAGAQAARRALPTARMVVVTGGGNHGQSLASPPNSCVNGYLNRYLATGALPAGTGAVSARCPANPLPVP
ncbi:MAG TPA: alpha/beta hydrolase [Streptosporangiaceae bacterium]|nr:alpha/beta hydrolase [Streptosporangiaceae bacterium]